jgi:hypothetical protein
MKRKNIIILSIILILLISISIVIILTNRGNKEIDNNETSSSDNDYSDIYVPNYVGEINMDDTDNSEIIDGEKYNTSSEIGKTHESNNGYKIENMKIYSKDGMAMLEFKLTNISDSSEYTEAITDIAFYNKDFSVIIYDLIYNIDYLSIGESKEVKLEIPYDIVVAYDYKFDLQY